METNTNTFSQSPLTNDFEPRLDGFESEHHHHHHEHHNFEHHYDSYEHGLESHHEYQTDKMF